MSVIAVSFPARNEARFATRAALFGVEVEKVEAEGNTVYADLSGNPEKCLRACLGIGVTVHDVTEYEEAPDAHKTREYGRNGTGIPIGDAVQRQNVYGRLMAKPA